MENYVKGKNVEEILERDAIPFRNLPPSFLWMQVKGGSKMNNLLSHASGVMEDKTTTSVVWTGAGAAISKAISCAEILKRDYKIDHQITKLCYKKVEEYWDPKIDGLEKIIVKRQMPVIHILLSTEPLDLNEIGYQSRTGKHFWQNESKPNLNKQFRGNSNKTRKPFKEKS